MSVIHTFYLDDCFYELWPLTNRRVASNLRIAIVVYREKRIARYRLQSGIRFSNHLFTSPLTHLSENNRKRGSSTEKSFEAFNSWLKRMIEKPGWLSLESASCSAVALAATVLEDEKAAPDSAQIRWQSTRDGLLLKSALASITDIDRHGVSRLAVNGHDDIHSASATDGLWKFEIHLIYAHQF